jgi:hypothetical protein
MTTVGLMSEPAASPVLADLSRAADMAAFFRLKAKDALSASTTARLCRLAVLLHAARTGEALLGADTSLINWPRLLAEVGDVAAESDLVHLAPAERRSLELAWAHRNGRPSDFTAEQLNPALALKTETLDAPPRWPLSA